MSTASARFVCLELILLCRATAGGEKDGGRGSNGGIWEWTSTVLDTREGFEGTTIFPG